MEVNKFEAIAKLTKDFMSTLNDDQIKQFIMIEALYVELFGETHETYP